MSTKEGFKNRQLHMEDYLRNREGKYKLGRSTRSKYLGFTFLKTVVNGK